jgi:hypothetical protein
MNRTLRPCPSCTRHIRASETSCPFCSSAIEKEAPRPAVAMPRKRLGRAGLLALGTLAGVACEAEDMITPVYGAPSFMDAGSNVQDAKADTKAVTNPDAAMNAPVYGAPAPPADAASCTTDAGSTPDGAACAPPDAAPSPVPAPVYGGPAPR